MALNNNLVLDLVNNENIEHKNTLAENQEANTVADSHNNSKTESGDRSGVFTEIMQGLSDHDALTIGPYKVSDLPIILIDDGFHFYANKKSLINEGNYFIESHHGHDAILRVDNHQHPALDLSVTNLVVFQWIAMLILTAILAKASGKYKKNADKAPKGFQNAIETMVMFIRDEVVRPNIPIRRASDRLMPYFLGLFFFILGSNLIGLLPAAHTPTGAIAVTMTLAIISFFVIQYTAIKEAGIAAWFKHLLGGAPWWLFFIMIPIEIVGMFIKPFALTIRLFANMTAGHVVLFALLGILFYFNSIFMSFAITPFSIFMYFLEALVAFIQAYLFTLLTAIFVGLAIGDHAHEHSHDLEHKHA